MQVTRENRHWGDRRAAERRSVCLLGFDLERRSGRERRSGYDRRTILQVQCLRCGLPLFGRVGANNSIIPTFHSLEQLRSRSQANVFLCPHCLTPHEECETYSGLNKAISFRVVGIDALTERVPIRNHG